MQKALFANITLILLIAFSFIILAQDANQLNKEDRAGFVENVSKLLVDNYVFEDVAIKIEKHLKDKLASGAFDKIADPAEFAALMTTEMQSISNDKHMRVRVRPPQPQGPTAAPNPVANNYEQLKRLESINYGFEKVEKLEGNIGYIELTGFPPLVLAKNYADAAMKLVSASDAIIFDLRRNGGGNPDLIQYICSYLFEKPTHINSLYYRVRNQTIDYVTFDKVDGKKMPGVPVFVLTSNFTFSGGEEFSYNIQTQKRGTLIGETTGGGANPGGMYPVTGNLAIFIPTGRAINPITKTNWEGVGVIPEIKCKADEALDTALPLAKEAAKKYREALDKMKYALIDEIGLNLEKIDKLYSENKNSEAEKLIVSTLDTGLKNELIDEAMINQFGYQKLGEDKNAAAIAIFKCNVNAFPNSANTYDSLGEAYLKIGDNDNARVNYAKSLKLNPENTNAADVLKKLESK